MLGTCTLGVDTIAQRTEQGCALFLLLAHLVFGFGDGQTRFLGVDKLFFALALQHLAFGVREATFGSCGARRIFTRQTMAVLFDVVAVTGAGLLGRTMGVGHRTVLIRFTELAQPFFRLAQLNVRVVSGRSVALASFGRQRRTN
jgi:hypothetical protein